MPKTILVSEQNDVTTITLNRPEKRNALNGEMVKEFLAALKQCESSSSKLLKIIGNGEHFCAGADLAWMEMMANASYETNYDDALSLANLFYELYHFPKPTVAMIQGAAKGGGMGIVAACDITFAIESATFGFPEVKLGLIPAVISPYIYPLLGERLTHYYFLTGETFSAEKAHEMGLIQHLVKEGVLHSAANELLNHLKQSPRSALRGIKSLIRSVRNKPITHALMEETAQCLVNHRLSQDGQEGLKAFLEKRQPNWVTG